MSASTQSKASGLVVLFSPQSLATIASSLLPGLLLGGTPSPLPDPHSEPTPVALPPIFVTGSLVDSEIPVVPLESIGSRNVFGPAQVRETGAREVNDLIQYLPAISTRPYNGGEAAAPSFSMRGLPDDGLTEYIHVLIDGVPASPLPYAWTAFSFLPVTPDRLFAVDYLRGAHSVRYSPNTVGGVLNLMTPPIPKAPAVQTRVTAGDYAYLSVLGSAGGTTGPTGLGMSYVYREGDGYRELGGFQQHDLNFKGRHVLDDQSWIAASVSYFSDEHQAPGGLTVAEFETDRFGNARPRNRFAGDRWVGDAVYQRNLEAGGSLVGFLYYSETYRALDAQRPHFGNPDTLLRWTDTSHFLGVGARVEKPFFLAGLENTLFAGWRYQREWLPHYRINSEPFTGGAGTLTQDQEFTLDTLSLHLDDTLHLHPRLTANLGVRLEWIPTAQGRDRINGWDFDDSFFAALPGAGLSFLLTDHWSLFGNYFLGFRAPQAWGYGSAAAAGHGLDLEHARSAELGTRVFGWAGFQGTATLWHNDYDDFGVFYDGSYNNLGEIRAQGVDLEIEWNVGTLVVPLDGLSLLGAVTFQDSELASGPFTGNDVPYAWHQKASWRFRYQRWGWTATLGGTYVDESFSNEANTTTPSADGRLGVNPARVVWDARLAKEMPLHRLVQLELAIGASNLFDEDWSGSQQGNLYQIVAWPHGVLDYRLIAHLPGREIHTLLAGDLDASNPGPELIVFTRPGGVYRVTPTGPHGTFETRHLMDYEGRVRQAAVLPQTEGQVPAIVTVSRNGRLELLRLSASGPEWRILYRDAMGLGRIALRPGHPDGNLVLYTTHDDGRILRHENDPKDDWNTEVIYLGPQGPRGLAAGTFGPSPDLETIAIFGYSRQVELLTRTAQGWQSEVIFEDLDKGHWLTAAELDGRNATRELITAGYSGRIVLLSRPPGFGRSELAVAPPETTGGAQ